jgi:hypothetical protein
LPIGYYTFLRIIETIGAIVVIFTEYRNEITLWIIAFGIIGILFNPILPIYLNDKTFWIIIDFAAGILFGIKAFTLKIKKTESL